MRKWMLALFLSFAGNDIKLAFSAWTTRLTLVIAASLLLGSGSFFVGHYVTALWLEVPFIIPTAIVLADNTRLASRYGRASIMLSLFVIIATLGFVEAGTSVTIACCERLAGCAIVGALVLWPLWRAYRSHAHSFATTVYLDFYAMKKRTPSP